MVATVSKVRSSRRRAEPERSSDPARLLRAIERAAAERAERLREALGVERIEVVAPERVA